MYQKELYTYRIVSHIRLNQLLRRSALLSPSLYLSPCILLVNLTLISDTKRLQDSEGEGEDAYSNACKNGHTFVFMINIASGPFSPEPNVVSV